VGVARMVMARNARRSEYKTMPPSLWYSFRSVNAASGERAR
jgi:hypothetical protein